MLVDERTLQRWKQFASRLTAPSVDLKTAEQRHQAQILAAFALALLVALFIAAPIWILTSPEFTAGRIISFGMLLAFSATYGLSRSRYYTSGALILVFAIFGMVIAALSASAPTMEKMTVLNFLIFAVIVASLFLNSTAIALVTLACLSMISYYFFVPEIRLGVTYAYLVFFILLTIIGWITIGAISRNRKRLLLSEERYRSAIEASLDAFYLLKCVRDAQGAISDFELLEANENAARQLSAPRAQLIGARLSQLLPHYAQRFLESFKQVVLTGNPLVEDYQVPAGFAAEGWYHQQVVRVGDGLAIVNRNITAAKQAEQALRHSETNLRTLFDSINDFIFVLDKQGNIIEINQTVSKRLGYTPEELIGQSVLTVHPAARRDEAAEIVTAMLAGVRTHCPVPIETKTHELIPVETTITQGLWNGEPALFGVTKDISALKLSEEKFAAVFQANPAIAGLSKVATGEYVEVNQAFCDKLGFTLDEVIGRKSTDVVRLDPVYRQKVIDKLNRDGYVQDEEAVIYTRAGRPIAVLMSAQILHLQGEAYNYTTAVDITERKQVEEALRESHARYQALLNALPDLVFRYSRDGTYLDYHAGTPSDLLLQPDRFLGRNMAEILPPALVEQHMHFTERLLTTGEQQMFQYTLTIHGEEQDFEVRIVSYRNDEVISIVRNITQLKRAQRQEFELALERERRQLLTSFIRDATHEFRTPLATISSSAYLLYRAPDPDQRQEKRAQIEREIERLIQLLDMLVLMTRLENLDELPFDETDLNDELERLCMGRPLVPGKRQTFHLDLQPDLPTISGNSTYLEHAFRQIFENAVRFTPNEGDIFVTSRLINQHIVIEVRDTGPGIESDHLPHIFKTFWRQDNAHSTPGFGLGLPIAHKIIQLHRGEITVQSRVGQGTTFSISLPIVTSGARRHTEFR